MFISFRTVNHDLHFVDPTTGVHTNTLFVCVVYTGAYTIEVKKLKGEKVAEDALVEFIWRRRFDAAGGRDQNTNFLNGLLVTMAECNTY